MRIHPFLWTAGLAVLALIAHFAVPLAVVEDGSGDTATREVWWPHDAADGADDPIPGGSMGYALAGLIVLALGGLAVLAGTAKTLAKIPAWTPGAAGLTIVGAALTLHNQALWAGRGVATLIERILGTDGPPVRTESAAFSADYHAAVWTISPVLVVAATLACLWSLFAGLRRGLDRDQSARHAVAAWASIAAVVFVLLAPWAMHTLDDAHDPGQGVQDTDPFVITAYTAARLQQDTSIAAQEQGEAGLEEYTEIAFAAGPLAPVVMAGLGLAGLAGLWGMQRLAANDKLMGRSAQYFAASGGGLVAGLWGVFVPTLAIFYAFPNDRLAEDARATYVPLLGAAASIWAATRLIAAIRTVAAETDALIADDFPERIVYD